ncbi:N-acetylmuramoyl-L-alanine amidase [Microcoleus sp. FACHB-1515]|uniref:N-acetylmuramoyl-L-alanine amidase n=1 Tax=Cyanophyceae TaxID=3028117 RepID=UPI0016834EDC|nr:N-acetylmuramoyl-L-alanine amidase [Microcoleus sp. FACHB-1515]MBD2089285.1 N-acetylmuramoyl-L-alanine amidase [Microcoleus sp. FACHB-1515]
MRTSSLRLLQDPTVVVLAAGHGGSDSGAVNLPHKERDQAIAIVDQTADLLRSQGIEVEIAPHSEDTEKSIQWVNRNFGFGDAWVLEVHRDSASGLSSDDASRRCGIYYGTSESSKDVGKFVRNAYILNGAHPNSWARPDTASRFGRLGWIRQTRPVAHLLELGFMQGKNDDAHLSWLAKIASAVIFDAFT